MGISTGNSHYFVLRLVILWVHPKLMPLERMLR